MQRAPGPSQLHREIVRRMKHLHQYDVLRCDRATSCHGLEIRVPFLDKSFIDLVLRLPAIYKLIPDKMEKFLLRSSFAGWLPDEVLWRSKEGFSEALGKVDLGDVVQAHADQIITDEQFEARSRHFPCRTPETKEEMWYRVLFEECFGYKQLGPAIDTKVYRTAEWQTWDEKENCKHQLDVKQAPMRLRRRSTGSSQLSGVA